LGVEDGYLLAGEVPEGHGLGDDVEGAGGAEGLAFGADTVFVVADVAQADKGDGVGKRAVDIAAGVTVAELCDEGDEDGFGEAVGFVEEDDEGAVEEAAKVEEPEGELAGIILSGRTWGEEGDGVSAQTAFDAVYDGLYPHFGVGDVAEGFERAVEGVVASGGVELSGEVFDAGGFAGLSCGVDEEVLLTVDEALQFGQAGDGGEDVVVPRVAGAGDVEEFGCFTGKRGAEGEGWRRGRGSLW
jgi:hypothetical protein